MPSEGNTPLAWEYAKCKNRGGDSRSQYHLYAGALNCAGGFRGRKLAMTDDPSRPATAAPRTERKQLTPAAKRALAEADARRPTHAGQQRRKPKSLWKRSFRVRRARNRPAMATGKTRALPPIFEPGHCACRFQHAPGRSSWFQTKSHAVALLFAF